MIGVKGQYSTQFSLGDEKEFADFLSDDDLLAFTIIEEAGNNLPSFELAFTTTNSRLLSRLTEGSVLKYIFGIDDNKSTTLLKVLKKDIIKQGDSYRVDVKGLYNAFNFVSNNQIKIYPKMSGVEVIKSSASMYFNTSKFNISKSNDVQTWMQPNIPDKKFINNVWMHSYIPGSFLATGITISGEYILKDVIKSIKDKPKWKLVFRSPKEKNEIPCNADYSVSSESGFINQWVGYGRTTDIRKLEAGEDYRITATPSTKIANSAKLDRADIPNRVSQFAVLNDNVHEYYWQAYYQNLTYLALMSNIRIIIGYDGLFLPDMRVLDIAMLEERDIGKELAQEQLAGLYVITKISRTYTQQNIHTNLEINREAFASISGSNLK